MKHVHALVVVVLTTALTAACSSSNEISSGDPLAPSNPAPPSEGSTNFESALTFCVTETNRYRAIMGLAALTRSGALEAYAAAGAQQDGLAHAPHQHFKTTTRNWVVACS